MGGRAAGGRAAQAARTKASLFRSAAKLIDKRGYDNATIEDICRRAGVSVGTFYHYYSSKADLMVELFKQVDIYYEERRGEILAAEGAAARLAAFFRCYAQFHEQHGYDHTSTILKVQSAFFNDRSRYMYRFLMELIEEGQADGSFAQGLSPGTAAGHMLIVARGVLFDWVLELGAYGLADKMEAEIAIAMRGIGGSPT